MSTSCFLLHSDNSTLNSVLRTVLTQEEIEEEAVLSANLKRNLANKALVCLYKLSFDDTDRCCHGIVRGLLSEREAQREVCSLEYVIE